MKQEIIDQLRAELHDTHYCKIDFERDIEILQDYDGPFFWIVRENGTSIRLVDAAEMLEMKNNQTIRFTLFRDKYAPIFWITHWNEPVKYFYYDGLKLQNIEKDDVRNIWDALFSRFYKVLGCEYFSEKTMCNSKLPIRYASEATKQRMNEALEFAESISDNSLKNCIERLSKHNRFAIEHNIIVYSDLADYSFGWEERINGECKMNGGIIYHQDKDNNHWQIHT